MKRRSADAVTGLGGGRSGPSSSSSRATPTATATSGVRGVGVGVDDTRVRGQSGSGGGGAVHVQGRGSSRRRLRRELNRSTERQFSARVGGGTGDLRSIGAVAGAGENAGASARVAPPSAPTLAAASTRAPPPLMCFSAEHRRRMGGAGSFLEGWISRASSCPSTNSPFVDGFEVDGLLIGMSVGYYGRNLHDVSEFLTRHRAMVALMGASGSSGASGGGDGGNGDDAAAAASASHVEVYTSAVSDFQSAQLALQGSGGAADDQDTTAMDDEDRRAVAVARRHGLALDAALAHASDGDSWFGGGGGGTTPRRHPPLLSAADVFHWHSLLCVGGDGRGGGDGLAGRYRVAEEGTRDGAAHSSPPDSVRDEMEALMRSLAVLERRWLAPRQDDCGTLHAVALAAAAMFGLWDVQPFPIANRVMAGILANWALRRAGVPFPFNPTSGVRELEGAMNATRDNAYLVATADADGRHFAGGINGYLRGRGVLAPLIRLILDRLAPAAATFRRTTLADRTRAATGEAEARAARRVRERAASSGSCAICLESNPNVAALCCGREVHLSCLSEWLRSNPTCVGCRTPLPLSSSSPGTSGTTGDGDDRDVDRRPGRRDRDVRGGVMAGMAATGESTGGGGAVEIDEVFADHADDHSAMSDSTGPFLRHDASSSEGSRATEVHVRPGVRMLHDSSSVGSGATEVHWSLEEESSSVGSEFHVRTTEEESSSVGSGTTEANRLREEEEAEAAEAEAFRRDPRGHVRRRRVGLFDDDDSDDDDGWTGGEGAETSTGGTASRIGSPPDPWRCGCPRSYGVCRNRAALDCTNSFCHPCCVLSGYHECARHGVEERVRE